MYEHLFWRLGCIKGNSFWKYWCKISLSFRVYMIIIICGEYTQILSYLFTEGNLNNLYMLQTVCHLQYLQFSHYWKRGKGCMDFWGRCEKILCSQFVMMMYLFPCFLTLMDRGHWRTFQNVRKEFFMNFKNLYSNQTNVLLSNFVKDTLVILPQ